MNIAQRVREILLTPKQAWPVIEAEQTDVPTLYTQYIMILALIPAVAEFIGMSLMGVNTPGHTIPFFSGIFTMVVSYAVSLAMFYAVALLADHLAPNFGGRKSLINALKLIAYSSTASMVGGIFLLVPQFWFLGTLASMYSLYLLFLGIPVMMKSPQEKTLTYTAILLVGGLVAGGMLGLISAIFR